MIQVPFIHLDEGAVTPYYGTSGSAGLDLTATRTEYLPGTRPMLVCYSGISVAIPEGHCGFLMARSSISRRGMELANGVGLIDSDYRGELIAKFNCIWRTPEIYRGGDVFAQLVILPIPRIGLVRVFALSDTIRGSGGFGSTDDRGGDIV